MKEIKIDSMSKAGIPLPTTHPFAVHEQVILREEDLTAAFKTGKCGLFPHRLDTILAGILVWLCEGVRPLTAWDGVEAFSTLRLNVAIRILKKQYRWPIESIRVPKRRPNGPTVYVTGYKLPQAFVHYASDNWHVKSWIGMVMLAQVRKRARDGDKAGALAFFRLTTGHPYLDGILSTYSRYSGPHGDR